MYIGIICTYECTQVVTVPHLSLLRPSSMPSRCSCSAILSFPSRYFPSRYFPSSSRLLSPPFTYVRNVRTHAQKRDQAAEVLHATPGPISSPTPPPYITDAKYTLRRENNGIKNGFQGPHHTPLTFTGRKKETVCQGHLTRVCIHRGCMEGLASIPTIMPSCMHTRSAYRICTCLRTEARGKDMHP